MEADLTSNAVKRGQKRSKVTFMVSCESRAGSKSADALILSTVESSNWTFDDVIIDSNFFLSCLFSDGRRLNSFQSQNMSNFVILGHFKGSYRRNSVVPKIGF